MLSALLYRQVPHARAEEQAAPRAARAVARIVYKLAALFSLDAFAGGFVVQSLLALWLFERFDLSLSAAGVFFFWAEHAVSAFSYPVAAWLAEAHRPRQHHGVHAHPLQHLSDPGGVRAESLSSRSALLLLRSALSQMDVPTRTSYVMAVVTPAERPAAASVTAVPRSLLPHQPGDCRRAADDSVSRPAAGGLRRAQDRLRSGAAVLVPSHQAAGRDLTGATRPRQAGFGSGCCETARGRYASAGR